MNSHTRNIAAQIPDATGVVCPGRPIEHLDPSVVRGYSNVVLMAGSNNISSTDSVNLISQKFIDLIKRIKIINKNCKLFIQELFPRHDITRENKIRFVNEKLKNTCSKMNVTLIPAPYLEKDEDYAGKGLHLNYNGKSKLASSIAAHISNFL